MKTNIDKNKLNDKLETISDNMLDSIIGKYINSAEIPKEMTENISSKVKHKGDHEISKSIVFAFIPFNFNVIQNIIFSNLCIGILSVALLSVFYPVCLNYEVSNIKDIKDKPILPYVPIDEKPEVSPNKHISIRSNEITTFEKHDNNFQLIDASPLSSSLSEICNFNKQYSEGFNNNYCAGHEKSALKINQISYDFRYKQFTNLTFQNQKSPDEAILKDYTFGLWYQYTTEIYLGLEFRQESYTILSHNSEIIYLQTSNMTTWELGIKYLPNLEIVDLKPYFQCNIGAGKLGLTTRLSLGLNYPITDNFNLILGTEISNLLYKSNNISSSWKAGLNIGFSANLK